MPLSSTPPHNVAIVHDYLTQRGGAERVVLALCRAFPDAPVYTSLYDPATTFPEFRDRDVRPLWLDRARLLRERHRLALPLLPLAFASTRDRGRRRRLQLERLGARHPDGRAQDRLLPLTREMALPPGRLPRRPPFRGGEAGPSPARSVPASLRPARGTQRRHLHRELDLRQGADPRRSTGSTPRCCTRRQASTPMGRPRRFRASSPGSCSTVARLLPYKHVAETVDAFRLLPEQRLVVVGEGPEAAALKSSLPGNVRLLGEVSDARLRWLYAHCVGLVAASREDFGLTPVEAAAVRQARRRSPLGRLPRHGRARRDGRPLRAAGRAARSRKACSESSGSSGDEEAIRAHAATFSEERFAERLNSSSRSRCPPRPRPEYPHDVGSEGMTGQGVAPDVRSRAEEIVGEPLLVAAASLVIERAAADAVVMLRGAGIRAILLKGPPQQEWLAAADPPRSSVDVDLFVDPAQAHAAGQALFDLGYRAVPEVTPGVGHHAVVWTAPGHVPVEVHDRLWGTRGDEWEVLNRETEKVMVAGTSVEVPNEAARCLVVALHAAHHGVGKVATLYDLERAVALADRSSWERAANLARAVGGEAAFTAGLGLVPAGERLRVDLGLDEPL